MYEVNANGNKSYRSASAKSVASVAVAWLKSGLAPKAYRIIDGDNGISTSEVPVTTISKTAKSLASA